MEKFCIHRGSLSNTREHLAFLPAVNTTMGVNFIKVDMNLEVQRDVIKIGHPRITAKCASSLA